MIPLPLLLSGTAPSDDESEVVEISEEVQNESDVFSPKEIYSTPRSSETPPLTIFSNEAERDSSVVIEGEKEDVSESSVENQFICGVATEEMRKSPSVLEIDQDIINELSENSPTSEDRVNFDNSFLNQLVSLEPDDEDGKICSESYDDTNIVREFPVFFSSFNDTTVLFNTTIAGDIDKADQQEKEANISDWVLKGNKYLEEQKVHDDIDGSKMPISQKSSRASYSGEGRSPKSSSRGTPLHKKGRPSKKEKEERRIGALVGKGRSPSPSVNRRGAPMTSRRTTPSRRAKSKVFLKYRDI